MRAQALVLPLVAALVSGACARNGTARAATARAGEAAVPVTVAPVVRQPMPVQLRLVGTVEPRSTVSVRALVGGELTAVHFEEGQEVQKDEVLFTIDPRPFEAQLHQSEATLARDTAQAQNAAAEVRRYTDLVAKHIATEQQLDTASTSAEALQATVRADTAAVENARLQLQYSTIRAPIAGRTGALMVNAGNVVKSGDTTALVVINQMSPIYVSFAVPQTNLQEIRRGKAAGTLKIAVELPDGRQLAERGTITFVDNAVDRSTGTIRVKGTFQNRDRDLWPGLFVNVVLTLRTDPRALVVPASAVQEGPAGTYVYVVKADDTVESHPVTVARTLGEQAVIDTGLAAGDTVVTDGQLRLVPGAHVSIQKGAAGLEASGS